MSSHAEMEEAGVEFFSAMFKEKPGCPIEEILKAADIFPNKISEDMNKVLMKKVSQT